MGTPPLYRAVCDGVFWYPQCHLPSERWGFFLFEQSSITQSTDGPAPNRVDLSKATKLQSVVFQPTSMDTGWIAATLKKITVKNRDFQQISVNVSRAIHLVEVNPGAS